MINKNLDIFKALGDKTRLEIIKALSQKVHCLEELAELLSLTPATLSHHMKKLEASGLVSKSREQYFTNFSLVPEIYERKLKDLIEFDSITENKEDAFRKKVTMTFMKRGKIIQLPRQHKKRLVLLEEILKHFQADKTYPENEVDKIIENIFSDYCTLRRMLIDERLMERNNGEYKIIKKEKNKVMETEKFPQPKTDSERKRELKLAYKETKLLMGIYKIENKANGKIFVGASQNIPGRFNRHEFLLKMGLHLNKELQADWNEFGKDKFTFELLEEFKDPDDSIQSNNRQLAKLKVKWLEKLQPFEDRGYNKKNFSDNEE